jgi:hypothetical protein
MSLALDTVTLLKLTMILNILNWLRKNKFVRKFNKLVKLGTLITVISRIIGYFPLSITFRLIWALLKISIFLVGASSVYLTSAFGDPSIAINLYNQIVNNVYSESHMFVQNSLRKFINFINK